MRGRLLVAGDRLRGGAPGEGGLVEVGELSCEFRARCAAAGFTVRSVTRLPAPAAMSVTEAAPDE